MSLARRSAAVIGVLFGSAPLAIVVAFVLSPVWRWLEAEHGIEAYGHSGPAEWCFVATYAACVVLLGAIAAFARRRRATGRPPGGEPEGP